MKKRDFKAIEKKLNNLTPERIRIARIFKNNTDNAIYELGPGYTVGENSENASHKNDRAY